MDFSRYGANTWAFESTSSTPRVTTFYSGQPVTTNGKVVNVGTLTTGSYNCNA